MTTFVGFCMITERHLHIFKNYFKAVLIILNSKKKNLEILKKCRSFKLNVLMFWVRKSY